MNVEQFSDEFKINTKRDGCGETIVPGKNLSHDVFLDAREAQKLPTAA